MSIQGLDYTKGMADRVYTREEFQQLIAEAEAAGGWRRCKSDNVGPVTYIHGPDGRITHEVWANIQPGSTSV